MIQDTCPLIQSSILTGMNELQVSNMNTQMMTTLLLLLGGTSESIFTNLSMIPTTAFWYLNLTPFETMFLGLFIVQITVLEWLQILPINLNEWLHGEYAGRRRRRRRRRGVEDEEQISRQKLVTTILGTLRRLDQDDCFQRTLCELEYEYSGRDYHDLPRETRLTLKALFRSATQRGRRKLAVNSNHTNKEGKMEDERRTKEDPLEWLEKAVKVGSQGKFSFQNSSNFNETNCVTKYSSCPATTQDILSNFDYIKSFFL